jgi:two-component system nitrogen regulation response regulator NtrX
MPSGHILVVDDEADIRHLIQEILVDEGYRVVAVESAGAAREAVRAERPMLALLDIWMPGEDGLSLLKSWAAAGLDFPVVIMSGHGTIETAVEATRLGAWDFIEKPLALAKLLLTLERALEANRLRQENAGLRAQLAWPGEPVGSSAAMQTLRAQLQRLVGHDAPVLLCGETGSGKEGLARWLHGNGPRRDGPFVVLPPAGLANDGSTTALLGSESAGQVQPGLIERAHGGSLFIDEVGQLDSDSQALLVDVLGRRQLLRVGGREAVDVDVRVIAATSAPLEARVAAGTLREDLFFLLSVVPIAVPPLRERSEDLPELLAYYADFYASRDRLPYRRFGVAAQNRLRQHGWPGNLRELRNLVQRLLLLGGDADIGLPELEAALQSSPAPAAAAAADAGRGAAWPGIDFDKPLREAREDFERLYLQHRLREAGGSVGKLAALCGLERTHLYRKLKDLGIDVRTAGDGGA